MLAGVRQARPRADYGTLTPRDTSDCGSTRKPVTDSTTIARDMRTKPSASATLAGEPRPCRRPVRQRRNPPTRARETQGHQAAARRVAAAREAAAKPKTSIDAALQQHGPLTINEIAGAIGIRPNYLYRAMPAGAKEGRYARDGNRWKLTDHSDGV